MKKYLVSIILLIAHAFATGQSDCETTINYGNNPAAGKYAAVNGIRMYYEAYGDTTLQPLLLIHGNGGSIASGRCQIEYFKDKYYIIAADSRFQGKSDSGNEELTYRLMAKDYNALLDHLKLDSLYVIGQSDGGIIGLLLAIQYPSKVKKLITTAPNVRPDSTAVYPWSVDDVRSGLRNVEDRINQGDTSSETAREWALLNMMDKYPWISNEELEKIEAPVLVVSSDADVIKPEHILEIYDHIPRSHLFIMPGATHFMLRDEHALFNQMAGRFLDNPFQRPTTKQIMHGQ